MNPVEGTFSIPCKTCGALSHATGLLQKVNPPNFEYKCPAGHLHWVPSREAEVPSQRMACNQCQKEAAATGSVLSTYPPRYEYKCADGHISNFSYVQLEDSVKGPGVL
jgi:hypothetical protein